MKKVIFLTLSIILTTRVLNAQETEKKDIKPALLVIDVQNAYLPSMDQSDKDRAIKMINGAIWVFNNFELPIIQIYHQDKKWGPPEDTY